MSEGIITVSECQAVVIQEIRTPDQAVQAFRKTRRGWSSLLSMWVMTRTTTASREA